MPKRGLVRFGKRGKLSPKYIRPFKVLERVGTVFHISMLWKHTPNLTHVVDWGKLVVDANGTFEEGIVRIMDSQDQVLRCKTVRLVKVLWQHRGMEEATWECEDTMHSTYPFLFEDGGTLSSAYACDSMYMCV